jgi:hypothetical protein
MYSNQTKVYYQTLDTTGGGGGGGGSGDANPFVTEALVLLDLYQNNDIPGYFAELPTYEQLKISNPTYNLNNTSNAVVQLIDIVTSLLIVKEDLENQIYILENEELCHMGSGKLTLGSVTINQNSALKLEYLQYLLMYDISLTNGIFMDSYLEEARRVLESNGGILKHFD